MGFFDRLTGNQAVNRKPTDDVLLLLSMLLMVGVDGAVEASELATMEAYFCTLPEFRGKDFRHLVNETSKIMNRYGGNSRNAVNALSDIENESIRRKCFVLAADIALASGDIDENEDQLLEAMARVLKVNDDLCRKTLDVLAMKYCK